MKRIAIIVIALAAVLTANAQAPVPRKNAGNPEKWIKTAFAPGAVPPFSFKYNGVPSGKFIRTWKYSCTKTPAPQDNAVQYSILYKDPRSGLRVRAIVTGYTDTGAIEWVLRFYNSPTANTGIISEVKTADFTLNDKNANGYSLRRLRGSNADIHDFEVVEESLNAGDTIKLATRGGRSSDIISMPFFNITALGADCGLVYAIGWTGNWRTNFTGGRNSCRVESGLKDANFYLKPGEDVRTPLASILFWTGKDMMAGHNAFRRHVMAHHSHKVDGKPWTPLAAGLDYGDPAPCNEYTCLTDLLARGIVQRHKQLDIMPEVFWLDAGWYEPPTGPVFNGQFGWPAVGTWVVDRERYPDGFVNMSNLMHSYGAQFMVWFEPERITVGSKFATEHPEYMLRLGDLGIVKEVYKLSDSLTEDMIEAYRLRLPERERMVFNLADDAAREYLCKYIGDLMEANGIDHYRQDFNLDFVDLYWATADGKDRRGVTEMKYIEGLYKYWDYLLNRFPGLRIDNCASGGRRIDLETISRAVPLWRTDYGYGEPLGYQCQTYGINFFLPQSGTACYNTDFYTARSGYSSAMVAHIPVLQGGYEAADIRRVYDEFKAVRNYFLKDYYPLSGTGDVTATDRWLAYQLDDPETRTGYVFAFRRPDCPQTTCTVDLRNIDPAARYLLVNCNTGDRLDIMGADLARNFTMTLEQAPGSILYRYEKN
ncbi:MAG: alpha-galactosidase [Bacteroidales bacterium]|nr:alpha-galactosidase [Bacteroidales bacterium]